MRLSDGEQQRMEQRLALRFAAIGDGAQSWLERQLSALSPDCALLTRWCYSASPVSDWANYEFSLFRACAEHALRLREQSPLARELPEPLFLNYVLHPRVNEEELCDCRGFFYAQFRGRIEGLSAREAILAINEWNAEQVCYRATDERTISALGAWRSAGRQGDPGASRFYLSLEDDLMRLFGGDRVSGLMDTLKIDEDTPIENRMITSTLESAQKKLEGRNFEIRKNVLKYDDVMNQQREIIYGQRRKVLDGEDISTEMHKMLRENIDSSCAQFLSGDVKDEWDFGALRRHYQGWLTTDADFHYTVADFDNLSQQGIADMLYDRGMQILQAKEVRYGAPVMRELERICLLKCVDRQWMDHIDNMDQLRQGIALRGYGQKDPVVEYRIEGFDMFDQMVDSIRESSVKMLLTIELRAAGSAPKREQVAKPTGEGFVPGNGAPGVKGSPKGQPVRVVKIGRNDPCPCGSGLKFKKCTCAQYHPTGNNGGEE